MLLLAFYFIIASVAIFIILTYLANMYLPIKHETGENFIPERVLKGEKKISTYLSVMFVGLVFQDSIV